VSKVSLYRFGMVVRMKMKRKGQMVCDVHDFV
jgi:hypothetical protein